jgi:hypothetical protein
MEGTYIIDDTILLPNNIEFSGLGISTILQLAPTQPNTQAMIKNSDSAAGNEWISIRDLTIDGNHANQTPGDNHYAIFFENVSNILIEGCHVKNMTGLAIYFLTSLVVGTACKLITITNNHFSDNHDVCINFTTTSADPADQLVMTHNTFGGTTGRTCIQVDAATDSVISNNNINNAGIHGMLLGGGVTGFEYSTVSHNICSGSTGGAGIFFANTIHTNISGNICRGNDTYGINMVVTIASNYNIIQGNVVYNNGDEGLSLNTTRSAIIGNVAYENSRDTDNAKDNILVAGDYNTVQGNVVHQSGDDKCRYGLRINSGTDNIVTGNQCDNGGGNAAADDYSDNGTTTVNANNNVRA